MPLKFISTLTRPLTALTGAVTVFKNPRQRLSNHVNCSLWLKHSLTLNVLRELTLIISNINFNVWIFLLFSFSFTVRKGRGRLAEGGPEAESSKTNEGRFDANGNTAHLNASSLNGFNFIRRSPLCKVCSSLEIFLQKKKKSNVWFRFSTYNYSFALFSAVFRFFFIGFSYSPDWFYRHIDTRLRVFFYALNIWSLFFIVQKCPAFDWMLHLQTWLVHLSFTVSVCGRCWVFLYQRCWRTATTLWRPKPLLGWQLRKCKVLVFVPELFWGIWQRLLQSHPIKSGTNSLRRRSRSLHWVLPPGSLYRAQSNLKEFLFFILLLIYFLSRQCKEIHTCCCTESYSLCEKGWAWGILE